MGGISDSYAHANIGPEAILAGEILLDCDSGGMQSGCHHIGGIQTKQKEYVPESTLAK